MIGYGLVSPSLIKIFAQKVVEVLGGGEAAVAILCETAAAETMCGQTPDKTRHGAGRGLCQVDQIGFDDVVARSKQSDIDALEKAFDFNLREVEWDDLNYSPLLSLVVCRLFYKLRPGAIPANLAGRAEYWKKWYNTARGKGSAQDYIFRVNECRLFIQ